MLALHARAPGSGRCSGTGERQREWFTSFVPAADTSVPQPKAPPRRDFLEARQVSLYQLVDGQEYKFDIPPYQRPYSWRQKQVLEMLQDFLAAYHSRGEYFLGAVVTVKAEDSVNAPLQVIDGQQRLTTLVILLAYAHAWARKQGNEVLERRLRRMLYIDADPLDPVSKGRFRVQLRPGDDMFFRRNLLASWRPISYQLSGVAAYELEQQEQGMGSAAPAPSPASDAADVKPQVAKPLENETWWRMYDNAGLIQSVLDEEVALRGLSLQDFLFHTLRSCYVVLMSARDEAASFRIFSTLNGRGMDLSMVDKLKADLLEVLDSSQRVVFAGAWAHMEDVLGRTAFHSVFDHMLTLAKVLNSDMEGATVLEYFGRKRSDPAAVLSIMGVALDYARILLQLRQCRFEVSPPPAVGTQPTAAQGLQLLAEDSGGGIVTSLDVGGPESTTSTHGAVRALERQARHMAFFSDDSYVAPTLEFFLQVDDMELRARFLRAAEALQLYLELCEQESQRAKRWQPVMRALLQRSNPACAEQLASVFAAVALTPKEKAQFRARLDQRDLASSADRRTLAHLLLRAEGAAVSTSPAIDFSSLQVDRVLPQSPPEGSMWRRSKISSPAAAEPSAPRSPKGAQQQQQQQQGAGLGSCSQEQSEASSSSSEAGAVPRASPSPPSTSSTRRVASSSPVPQSGPTASASSEGHKYWYEVQRMFWHGKLGNLILLPIARPGLAEVASADYNVKAAYYSACDVERLLPEFSGSVLPSGRFGAWRFSFEECKRRHAELLARVCETFLDPDWEDELWQDYEEARAEAQQEGNDYDE